MARTASQLSHESFLHHGNTIANNVYEKFGRVWHFLSTGVDGINVKMAFIRSETDLHLRDQDDILINQWTANDAILLKSRWQEYAVAALEKKGCTVTTCRF